MTSGQEELRALIARGAPKAELEKIQGEIEGVQVLASEARAEIDERREIKSSVMPDGLAGNLTVEQLASLVTYLESLRSK